MYLDLGKQRSERGTVMTSRRVVPSETLPSHVLRSHESKNGRKRKSGHYIGGDSSTYDQNALMERDPIPDHLANSANRMWTRPDSSLTQEAGHSRRRIGL